MVDAVFNLLVSSVGWDAPSGNMPVGRVLNQTDQRLVDVHVDASRNPDFAKLKQYPALFMPEGPTAEPQYGRIGKILSVVKSTSRQYTITFQFDDHYPCVPFNSIVEAGAYYDLFQTWMATTHWSLKDADLFDIMLRASKLSYGNSGYRMREQIGQGGFGVVHRAERSFNGVVFQYALKTFNPSAFVQDHDRARIRFLREIIALQKLQHNAIVSIVDAGVAPDGQHFLVMPLIQGVGLREATGVMPFIERIRLFEVILSGIEHAHSNDVLHRDIKPSNILVRSTDGHPQIIDFGAAYVWDVADEASLTFSALGTPGYIPFEVFSNPRTRSPLHDIYSLGVVLYEILAGRRPPDPYQSLGDVSPELASIDAVVQGALSPTASRIPSATEFKERIRAAISSWQQ